MDHNGIQRVGMRGGWALGVGGFLALASWMVLSAAVARAADSFEAAGGSVARPAEGAGRLTLHLSAPMRGQWKVLDADIALRDLRVDLRLGPRGVPKHRFPRGTVLQAERGTTWVEFIGGPLDDVLALRIDCRTEKVPEKVPDKAPAKSSANAPDPTPRKAGDSVLDVIVTPYLRPDPTSNTVRYTEYLERRLDQLADVAAQRAELQLRMLGAVPAKDGRSAPRGASGLSVTGIRAKMLADYQYQAARETQKRLGHFERLRDQLDGIAELEVRVVRADEGRSVHIAELASTSTRALDLGATYGGTAPPIAVPRGRPKP